MYHNIHYKYYTHTLTDPHHWHSAVDLPLAYFDFVTTFKYFDTFNASSDLHSVSLSKLCIGSLLLVLFLFCPMLMILQFVVFSVLLFRFFTYAGVVVVCLYTSSCIVAKL